MAGLAGSLAPCWQLTLRHQSVCDSRGRLLARAITAVANRKLWTTRLHRLWRVVDGPFSISAHGRNLRITWQNQGLTFLG